MTPHNTKEKPSLIVVTGPTASGKTRAAIELAQAFDGEIINADSVQVYEDFNIGAWKASEEELATVAHHLVSFSSPSDPFNAGQFRSEAEKAIAQILGKGKIPIVAGGTGLYIRTLLCGLVDIDEPSEEALDQIEQRGEDANLFEWLTEIDSQTASQLHPSDDSRIRRALLVKLTTGQSLAELQAEHKNADANYRALVVVLLPDREKLYELIDARVVQMVELGLVDEVRGLLERYPKDCRAFGAIGYRQVVAHLAGDYDFDEMIRRIQRDTRRFAKRQLTWWRNQPEALGWQSVGEIDGKMDNPDYLTRLVEKFLAKSEDFRGDGVAFLPLENVELAGLE